MVVYAAVAVTVIGNLPIPQLISAKDYALAQAAQPFLGTIGFKIIAIAALFSTASGINATLYGGANVSYALARDGQLPSVFERKVWGRGTEGLFITAGLTIVFANVFDLSGIAGMASASVLVIMVAGNVAHMRLYKQTGARRSVIVVSTAPIIAFFGAIVYYQMNTAPFALTVLVFTLISCFFAEMAYRRLSNRTVKTRK